MPVGTVCADPCDDPDHDYHGDQATSSTCECDHGLQYATNTCNFNQIELATCGPV